MTFTTQLQTAQRRADSMLCVGLDPEPARFPGAWAGDASRIFDFCAAIGDATHDLVIAFKPQIAYFAAHRAEGQLERLIQHIKQVAPDVPVILDAKRGDIGATAAQYAVEAFERYQADAVTLSPLMGFDSLEPWLKYPGKGLFLLCRTSNPGGSDLQAQRLAARPDGQPGQLLYEHIAGLAAGPWSHAGQTDLAGQPGGQLGQSGDLGHSGNLGQSGQSGQFGQLGLVVGATYPAEIDRVRTIAPTLPLLIPGVGAQGGDALATVRAGWRGRIAPGGGLITTGPIIVNSSRAVLYASAGADFAAAARRVTITTRALLRDALPVAA